MMAAALGLGWPACSRPGCTGSGTYGNNRDTCLGHLAEDELESAVERPGGELLDARGVTVSPELLSRLLGHARAVSGSVRFDSARFQGPSEFGEAVFRGDASFAKARFDDDASFAGATFEQGASFEESILDRKSTRLNSSHVRISYA